MRRACSGFFGSSLLNAGSTVLEQVEETNFKFFDSTARRLCCELPWFFFLAKVSPARCGIFGFEPAEECFMVCYRVSLSMKNSMLSTV